VTDQNRIPREDADTAYSRIVLGRELPAEPLPPALTLADLCDDAYPDPNPYDMVEEFRRWRHEDVGLLDDDTLLRERTLAKLRWATTETPSTWLRDRLHVLDAEAGRRRGRR
jgi:hypothetical protein